MTRLRCLLNIHRPEWTPAMTYTQVQTGAPFTPPIRRCHDCGQPIPRRHR